MEEGATIVAEHMEESGALANEIENVLMDIAVNMMEITNKNFTSEGRRGGGSWKRLATSTILRKGHSQILVETGDLIDSLTMPGHEYSILNFTPEGLEYGTDRPWAFVHQHGRNDGTIPQRQFLEFLPSDEARWRAMFEVHILRPFSHGTGVGEP